MFCQKADHSDPREPRRSRAPVFIPRWLQDHTGGIDDLDKYVLVRLAMHSVFPYSGAYVVLDDEGFTSFEQLVEAVYDGLYDTDFADNHKNIKTPWDLRHEIDGLEKLDPSEFEIIE